MRTYFMKSSKIIVYLLLSFSSIAQANVQKSFLDICNQFKKDTEVAKNIKDQSNKQKNPLAPSDYVNKNLTHFVSLATGRVWSKQETQRELKTLNDHHCIQTLRDLSILAEEQMENKAIDDFYSYYQTHAIEKHKTNLSISEKIAFLEKMMNIKKGYKFQYLGNYFSLVANEMAMLNELKKRFPHQHFHVEHFHGDLPNLKNKYVTFVGAGFPLSGVVTNILTNAKVNLIDIDSKALIRAKHFLEILNQAGIINIKNFSLKLANGEDLIYSSQPSFKKNVRTDVLYLASALPNQVKSNIFHKIHKDKNDGLVIIDRYVSGIYTLFYDKKVKNSQIPSFKTLAKIYPENIIAWKIKEKENIKAHISINPTSKLNLNSSRLLILQDESES